MDNYIFSGVDTVGLAREYGTPLYVMSEDIIKERTKEVRESFLDKYENTRAVYASKAFLTKEMARIVTREGLGMDAVSGGEIYVALKAGFPMEDLIFHGNNKTLDELNLAIESGVGRIVVDNIMEMDLIQDIATRHGKYVDVLFRISPGIDSDTHKYIQTAQVDSKFGIPLSKKTIDEAVKKLLDSDRINFKGFHFHIGSQLNTNQSHLKAIDVIIKLARDIRDEYGLEMEELNTGGGYGINYTDEERKPLSYFIDPIMEGIKNKTREYGLKMPKVIIEPGRWLVGEAGMTIYRVGSIKEIPNTRTYVSIDGGMPDNPRPSLYQAEYRAEVLNKWKKEKTDLVTIAGKCCESGDILIWDIKLPKLDRGDYLGVFSTGAYNYSMSSNYNKLPRPAVVMVNEGKSRLIVRRETYDDLLRNEI